MSNRYRTSALIFRSLVSLAISATASLAWGMDLAHEVAHPGFNKALTSIAVVDAGSGREIAGYLPDVKLNPASCAKILTAAAALSLLGPDHRFHTDFFADRAPAQGTIGTLYVAGSGDPMLINEELAQIAMKLAQSGVRRIADGIVIDNSFFDSYDYPHKQTGEGRAYTAKTSATAVNFNSIAVEVGPGPRAGAPAAIALDPPTDYYTIVNKVVTGGKFRAAIAFGIDKGRPAVIVTGRVPLKFEPQKLYRSAVDPAAHAGAVLASWLAAAGIDVAPPVREGRVPKNAVGLLRWESRPLAEIIASMNKVSNNFIAEQLLKHLGAVKFGAPGSTEKGVAAVEGYLASIGIPPGSYTFENGSGLSDSTRLSARQLVAVLVAAYKDPRTRQAFVDSLSVLGIDGTTKKWRTPIAPDLIGRIFVKTGTLDGVSTLAGYAPTADGRTAAFAILANGLSRGAWTAHEAELMVVRAITGGRP